jgi:hypothetical protein
MNSIITVIEDNVFDVMAQFQELLPRIGQLQEVYAQINMGAIALGDPASVIGKLTKADIQKGATTLTQLGNFLSNAAVTQDTYNKSLLRFVTGNTQAAPATVNVDIEYFATGLIGISTSVLFASVKASTALNIYFANGINSIVSALSSSSNTIPGGTVTPAKLSTAMVFCTQLQNMINNLAVVTGDYKTTVAQWKR